jgi:D-alanyl-D-alanine carboxypeptidase
VGIEGINQRIADIQSRIIALQTQQTATRTVQNQPSTTTPGAGGEDFASYLSDAVATQAAPRSTSGRYQVTSKGIPADLAAYGNGKIPANALQPVGSTRHKLWAPAAESLTRMIADAQRDGVRIGITDSYRPYAEQVDLAKRKGLYSQGGLAAKPGTSEHGWGMAADLDLSPKALTWMRRNAEEYGFVNNVARESWHWAFKPKSL